MLLQNKVILVVGAGGLLGREIVRSVVREGGRVIAADMDKASVSGLAQEFGKKSVFPVQIDITDNSSIESVFDIAAEFGLKITGAVNSAVSLIANLQGGES